MWHKIINNYIFTVSTRKNKKYDVYDKTTKKYLTSFGDKRYQHYYDKLNYYSNLNHNDDIRRERYLKRHKNDFKLAGKMSLALLW